MTEKKLFIISAIILFAAILIPAVTFYIKQIKQPALIVQVTGLQESQEIKELKGVIAYLRNEVLLLRVQQCESDFRHNNLYGDAGEYGSWQFMRGTFEDFKNESGHSEWNWYNRDHQDAAARWAFENGYAKRWTCYSKVCAKYPELCVE